MQQQYVSEFKTSVLPPGGRVQYIITLYNIIEYLGQTKTRNKIWAEVASVILSSSFQVFMISLVSVSQMMQYKMG